MRVFVVVKSGDEVSVFPFSRLEEAKSVLKKHEKELMLLPDGNYAVFVGRDGKVEFKKLSSVEDDPDVKMAVFSYIPKPLGDFSPRPKDF